MAPGASGWERIVVGRDTSPVPPEADPDEAALAAALSRHETALARLRLALPSPSTAIIRELEAAERALRDILARRDGERR